jgi:hypothetical protein
MFKLKDLDPLGWTKCGQVLEEFGYFNFLKFGKDFA